MRRPLLNARRAALARAAACLALAASLSAAGCSRPAPVATRVPTLRSQALIDSGNASYRGGDYSSAAKRYASAAVANPEDPAAFYGLGMALAKLGRDDEARVAYAKSRALAAAHADTAIAR